MEEQKENTVPQEQAEQTAKYTDADVDAIIDKKFAKWKADQDKAVAEAVAKVEEANRLAQMSDKQKADFEREQMEKELASLKAEKAHGVMVDTARKMFKADGLTVPDEIINVLVTDNAETTSEAVKSFSALFQKAVNEAVREQLKGSEPKKGSVPTGLTKEQIMQIKDTKARLKAIEENIGLFKENFGGK